MEILLVSENAELLLELSESLHESGCSVAATATTSEAIAAMSLYRPAVLVVDLVGSLAEEENFRRLREASWATRLIVLGGTPPDPQAVRHSPRGAKARRAK
jgi:DNA-binding response OmpR family regulator